MITFAFQVWIAKVSLEWIIHIAEDLYLKEVANSEASIKGLEEEVSLL